MSAASPPQSRFYHSSLTLSISAFIAPSPRLSLAHPFSSCLLYPPHSSSISSALHPIHNPLAAPFTTTIIAYPLSLTCRSHRTASTSPHPFFSTSIPNPPFYFTPFTFHHSRKSLHYSSFLNLTLSLIHLPPQIQLLTFFHLSTTPPTLTSHSILRHSPFSFFDIYHSLSSLSSHHLTVHSLTPSLHYTLLTHPRLRIHLILISHSPPLSRGGQLTCAWSTFSRSKR